MNAYTKHEQKACPRCGNLFICKPGDIAHCQCSGIRLTQEEAAYVRSRYEDCLCSNCLVEMQEKPGAVNKE